MGILERSRPLIPRECPTSPIHGLYIPANKFPLKDLPEKADHEEGVANPTRDDIRSALSRRQETIMRQAPGAMLVFLTCLTPGMGGTEIFRSLISPEALMLGNEVFESTEKSIVVHRAFTAKEIITYATATGKLKGGFQTLVGCSRDTC